MPTLADAERALAPVLHREILAGASDAQLVVALWPEIAALVSSALRDAAAEIERELVCCDGVSRHGGGICHWSAAARELVLEAARSYTA